MKTRQDIHRQIVILADECLDSGQNEIARVLLCLSGALHLANRDNTDDLVELSLLAKNFALKAKTRLEGPEIKKNSGPLLDKQDT